MEYRLITRDEIDRFVEINREEIVEQVYYYRDGELVLENEFYDIPDWSQEKKEDHMDSIRELHDRGGLVYAAFEDDRLVGMVTLDSAWLDGNLLNLNGLWVSREYRGRGVATHLVYIIVEEAKRAGADGVYVSATESKNTVEFYMNRGFQLTDLVNPILYEEEPCDIHMVMIFDQKKK